MNDFIVYRSIRLIDLVITLSLFKLCTCVQSKPLCFGPLFTLFNYFVCSFDNDVSSAAQHMVLLQEKSNEKVVGTTCK